MIEKLCICYNLAISAVCSRLGTFFVEVQTYDEQFLTYEANWRLYYQRLFSFQGVSPSRTVIAEWMELVNRQDTISIYGRQNS